MLALCTSKPHIIIIMQTTLGLQRKDYIVKYNKYKICVYIYHLYIYIYIYGQMIYIHTHIYKQILTRSHIYVCVYALEFVHDHHSITYLVVNLCNYNNVIICKNVAFSHE